MKTTYKISSVQYRLQKAIELELSTIPPYLTAYFSIKPNTNKIAAEILRSILMEEMLHLALAGNILNAIGGKISLTKDNIPKYPLRMKFNGKEFKNREFDINLGSFSQESLELFLAIELPEYINITPEVMLETEIPAYTIGEFYNDILEDLTEISHEIGEDKLFIGNIQSQLTQQYYWHGEGNIVKVNNLQSAAQAINMIVEQGEGSSVTELDLKNLPHYHKFNELFHGKHYSENDTYKDSPSGKSINIDYNQVYNIKPNCTAVDFRNQLNLKNLNDMFNQNYTSMLSQIEEGFNGNPIVFYSAIMNSMHQMAEIARNMMEIDILEDPFNRTGAPSFEWHND